MLKYHWPDAPDNHYWGYESPDVLNWTMSSYKPQKDLYGIYEGFLSDSPPKLTLQQEIWLKEAIKGLLKRAAYIYYNNDDTILEEYKYLSYQSHIYYIMMETPGEFSELIAAMAAWATYEGDVSCLRDMLSRYQEINNKDKKRYTHQLIDSLTRKRDNLFERSLDEIKEIRDTLFSFFETIKINDYYVEKDRDEVLLFINQGYEEKKALDDYKKVLELKKEKKGNKQKSNTTSSLPKSIDFDPSEKDEAVILKQLTHFKWQYDFFSDNPDDQQRIKRNIKTISHIDWKEVDYLIKGNDARLSSQMTIFKEAVLQIKEYNVWNEFDIYCPETIEVTYKYPDGKTGDIDRALALCYGIDEPVQVDALHWKVSINSRENYDIIDMIANGKVGVINDKEEAERIQSKPHVAFLISHGC